MVLSIVCCSLAHVCETNGMEGLLRKRDCWVMQDGWFTWVHSSWIRVFYQHELRQLHSQASTTR